MSFSHRLCSDGSMSLYCFLGTDILIFLSFAGQIIYGIIPNIWGSILWGPILYYALINMIIRYLFRGDSYQIALRASFLGFLQAVSLLVLFFSPVVWKQFGLYGAFVAFFHFSEFFTIAWSNPDSLSTDSFILNHSIQYGIAAVLSWLEFVLEAWFVPSMKGINWISECGILFCIFGEIIRKTAMITAQCNFTHLVQYEKKDDHRLVTHGIYGYMRHPSYVGWFWWSIGTQVILCNPVCTILYIFVVWKFFNDRIFIEELTLLNFFGVEYYNYQKYVPTGLPFIKGYVLD